MQTITGHADFDTMELINTAVREGRKVTINGERVFKGWQAPVHVYGNGAFSINMVARTKKNSFRPDYFEPGATFAITIA